MSNENDSEIMAPDVADEALNANKDLFTAAYFAALQGLTARTGGQDAGMVVNEAYKLAEYTVERFTIGKSIMTDAQRAKAAKEAPAVVGKAMAPLVTSTSKIGIGNVFPRPGT